VRFSLALKFTPAHFIIGHRRSSGAQSDLEALLVRMKQRWYPESIPVLASYWLKTVYASGHKRRWWKELNEELKRVLREQPLDTPSRDALAGIQREIDQKVLLTGKTPEALPPRLQPFRANLKPEWLAPYIGRLLNEWLPAEVAYLLLNESEPAILQDGGIPAAAIGRALERLLVRERLSPATLEMLLEPGLLSPKYVYPADAEILRDVVLALLGRTWAPPPPVMPATVLGVATGAALPAQYSEAVRRACFAQCQEGDKIRVPIAAPWAAEILQGDPVRIGSIVVTMDGRWWEPENLQTGEEHTVVYKPGGRLRIDYSADHAKLVAPWPETQLRWPGAVRFCDPVEIFGREWRASSWETDGKRTELHLTFSRALPMARIPAADMSFRRSRPAAVDMAWASLENALGTSLSQRRGELAEELCRPDLIPLGRAIYGLVNSVNRRRLPKRETIETQLRAVRYLQADISNFYGRVPWRILPAGVRGIFLKRRPDPALLGLLNEVFDELPEALTEVAPQSRRSDKIARSVSPPQAA
jgi:hypothetical protein